MTWHTKNGAAQSPELETTARPDGTAFGSSAARGPAPAPGRLASHPDKVREDVCGAAALLDFQDLYERHFEFVWRSLRLLGVHFESLEDAAQDVFGAIARQLDQFEGRSSLRTWIFGVTQNIASNYRRTRSRKLERLEPLADGLAGREPTPQAHAEGMQAADLVSSFCGELDESRRVVFVLGIIEDVPASQIATLLDVPLNTVYSRIHALRRALKARLEQQ